jgi:hypothetical protein
MTPRWLEVERYHRTTPPRKELLGGLEIHRRLLILLGKIPVTEMKRAASMAMFYIHERRPRAVLERAIEFFETSLRTAEQYQ